MSDQICEVCGKPVASIYVFIVDKDDIKSGHKNCLKMYDKTKDDK